MRENYLFFCFKTRYYLLPFSLCSARRNIINFDAKEDIVYITKIIITMGNDSIISSKKLEVNDVRIRKNSNEIANIKFGIAICFVSI